MANLGMNQKKKLTDNLLYFQDSNWKKMKLMAQIEEYSLNSCSETALWITNQIMAEAFIQKAEKLKITTRLETVLCDVETYVADDYDDGERISYEDQQYLIDTFVDVFNTYVEYMKSDNFDI